MAGFSFSEAISLVTYIYIRVLVYMWCHVRVPVSYMYIHAVKSWEGGGNSVDAVSVSGGERRKKERDTWDLELDRGKVIRRLCGCGCGCVCVGVCVCVCVWSPYRSMYSQIIVYVTLL